MVIFVQILQLNRSEFVNIQRILKSAVLSLGITALSTGVHAQAAANEGYGSSSLAQIAMLVAFGLIFYFMVFRPQSKRARDHRDLVCKLQKGDEVLTSGGMLGKISKVTDDFFLVTIAEGIDVMVQKQAIASALPKGTMKSIN